VRVTFACGSGGPNYAWNDIDVETGIGGSEECVILLARELAKLGYEVVVYNNCAGKTGRFHGVEYCNYTCYDKMPETDVLIAWRNWYLLIGKEAKYKWLWCHDIPVACHCPCREEIEREDSALNHIDKFILLNHYHKNLYVQAGIPEEKCLVAPIGVDPEQYDKTLEVCGPGFRDPARVLYFSHPDRGLDRLREVWPEVKAAVPEAVLASFWWEPEHYRPAREYEGILPMKKLGFRDIAIETLKAGVFGYPCIFQPEISPATTIKAQFGGAVPVVVMQGGMCDTIKYGVKTSQEFFAQELISTLKMSIAGDLEDERAEMMAWARQTYSWESVAALWSIQWE
jgi:glycosyltransferase involved in cell wall biosynthesis